MRVVAMGANPWLTLANDMFFGANAQIGCGDCPVSFGAAARKIPRKHRTAGYYFGYISGKSRTCPKID
jgi:hypothetical protein